LVNFKKKMEYFALLFLKVEYFALLFFEVEYFALLFFEVDYISIKSINLKIALLDKLL